MESLGSTLAKAETVSVPIQFASAPASHVDPGGAAESATSATGDVLGHAEVETEDRGAGLDSGQEVARLAEELAKLDGKVSAGIASEVPCLHSSQGLLRGRIDTDNHVHVTVRSFRVWAVSSPQWCCCTLLAPKTSAVLTPC